MQLVQGRWRRIAEAHVDLAEGDGGVDDGEGLYFVQICLFQRMFSGWRREEGPVGGWYCGIYFADDHLRTVAVEQKKSSQPNGPLILDRRKMRMPRVKMLHVLAVLVMIMTDAASTLRSKMGIRGELILLCLAGFAPDRSTIDEHHND